MKRDASTRRVRKWINLILGGICCAAGLVLIVQPKGWFRDLFYVLNSEPGSKNLVGGVLLLFGLIGLVTGIFDRNAEEFAEHMERKRIRRLAGRLPEILLLAEDKERRRVLLNASIAMYKRRWPVALTLAAAYILIPILLIRPIGWPALRLLHKYLGDYTAPIVASTMVLFAPVALMIWFHRRYIRPFLREQLIAANVPVCIGCGYYLHGIASTKCPECGRQLEQAVLDLIAKEASNCPPQVESADRNEA